MNRSRSKSGTSAGYSDRASVYGAKALQKYFSLGNDTNFEEYNLVEINNKLLGSIIKVFKAKREAKEKESDFSKRIRGAASILNVEEVVEVVPEAHGIRAIGFEGESVKEVNGDMCFMGKLSVSKGWKSEKKFYTGIVEFKTTSTLPIANFAVKDLKKTKPYKDALGQSFKYSVYLIQNLVGLFGWEKLRPILGDYHVDHVVVTPEVVILCRLGFNNFNDPLFYTHSEKVFTKERERALVFSQFLQKQKEICIELTNLIVEDTESKHCWLPLQDNVNISTQENFEECGTRNSNIWKGKEFYYKRVNKSANSIYRQFNDPCSKFFATRVRKYFYKIPDYGSRIERKDIIDKDNTIEIFKDLVEQLEVAFKMDDLCHRDIRLPNIVFKDGKATLIDWDYADMVNTQPSAIFSTFLDHDGLDFYEVVPERDLYALSCLALWGISENSGEPDEINWNNEYDALKVKFRKNTLFEIAEILREPYDDYKEKLKYNGECHKDVLYNLEELRKRKHPTQTIDLEENQDVKKRKVTPPRDM